MRTIIIQVKAKSKMKWSFCLVWDSRPRTAISLPVRRRWTRNNSVSMCS